MPLAVHLSTERILFRQKALQVARHMERASGYAEDFARSQLCIGYQQIVFPCEHAQPYTDRQPGMTLDGIGLFSNGIKLGGRMVERRLLIGIARCQTLLQYGHPVAPM